jgi:ABC-2 type transport system permease protein
MQKAKNIAGAAPFNSFLPFYTLLKKEVLRFITVFIQTLITPVITASLYLFVFGLSLGSHISVMGNVPYIQFVVPGLILMGVVNNAFQNTSSSLFFSRYLNNIVDLLVTPITPWQFILAYTIAAMLRGFTVGLSIWLISIFFTDLPWVDPVHAIVMLTLANFLFAQLGIVAAIFSASFDHLSMFSNFLILPLIYLGGVFYPISQLPPLWKAFSQFNPLFFLIDGFRQGVLGQGDNTFHLNLGVAVGLSVVLFVVAATLIGRGVRLRS